MDKVSILQEINTEIQNMDLSDVRSYLNGLKDGINEILRGVEYPSLTEKKEKIRMFLKDVSGLRTAERVALKRSLGVKSADDAVGLYSLLYKFPDYGVYNEDRKLWILVARIYTFLGENVDKPRSGDSFAKALGKVVKSESGRFGFESFLSDSISRYEYFERNIIRYVHMIKSKGLSFDCVSLLNDLLYWDHPKKYVQIRWYEDFDRENSKN